MERIRTYHKIPDSRHCVSCKSTRINMEPKSQSGVFNIGSVQKTNQTIKSKCVVSKIGFQKDYIHKEQASSGDIIFRTEPRKIIYNVIRSLNTKTNMLQITICILLVILSNNCVTCNNQTHYPPFFNVALEKSVTVNPLTAVCGLNEASTYCESRLQQQNLCDELDCRIACESDTILGFYIELLNSIETPEPWQCATRNNTFYSMDALTTTSFKFQSQISPCYLPLATSNMFQLRLYATWSQTYAFWIRHDLEVNKKGTIIDFRNINSVTVIKVRMDGSFVTVAEGNNIVGNPTWEVPRNVWTHVAIQIFENRTSVFINGTLMSSMYNAARTNAPNTVATYYLGDSQSGGENFVGYLQELKLYVKSVSNREILEIMMGTLPTTRIENDCRCPPGYPQVKPDDMTRCIQNPGPGSTDQESYRVTRKSFLPGFINDGKLDTKWISQPPTSSNPAVTDETQIIIELQQVFEVRHVEITFYSPYPSVIVIQRQRNSTSDFEDWQLYSDSCRTYLSYTPNEPLATADDVSCKFLVEVDQITPYSSGAKKFDLLDGRPGQSAGGFSPGLRDFLQAYAVKVILRGHDYVTFDKHKYHSVYEVTINATCDCHGHGTECDTSLNPYHCTCAPESYTEGQQCDQCVQNTYRLPEKDVYDPDLCLPCDCHVDGTVGGNMACDVATGQCQCKTYVEGLQCNNCKPNYYLLDANNPDGCSFCRCDSKGVFNTTAICHETSGECLCKDNVIGEECERVSQIKHTPPPKWCILAVVSRSCKPLHYGLSQADPLGCSSCDCYAAGVIGADLSCDNTTGQCGCKRLATGRKCDKCEEGYYNLDTDNTDGCVECGCDPSGSHNSSCDLITGQCFCKANVIGRTCNTCESGYFALDDTDFRNNGCMYACNCSDMGTVEENTGVCNERGGQCECKANTEGQACDQCKLLSYGFGTSTSYGCTACDCDERGTVDIGETCDSVTGQCNCKTYATSRRCDHCTAGYFNLNAGNNNGCEFCDCSMMGTNTTGVCNEVSGQCMCNSGQGDPSLGGKQCEPYTSSVVPVYGPESGGTEIIINGGYFGDVRLSVVHLGQMTCPVDEDESSPIRIKCTTSPLNETTQTLRDIGQQIVVELADGSLVDTNLAFTYKEDPIISSVEPLRSILSGGILLTVTGMNLDSIAFPYMEITMVFTPDDGDTATTMFDSVCNVQSGTQMTCPTPNITLPANFNTISSNQRRKRQAIDVVEYKINSDALQFYVGFRLDGVTLYRNLSISNPQYSILNVFFNPEFEDFEGGVRLHRPYWPFSDTIVTINGERLNYGATMEDYTIVVGAGTCTILEVLDNAISCTPPNSQPDPGQERDMDGVPGFVIKVGNIKYLVGYLKYEHSFFDNPTYRWAIIGGAIGLLILIILLIVCCCLICRKRKDHSPPEKKLSHLDQFDHFDTHHLDTNLNSSKPPPSSMMIDSLDGRSNTSGAGGNYNEYTAEMRDRTTTTLPLPVKNGNNHQYRQQKQPSNNHYGNQSSAFMPTTLPLPQTKSDFSKPSKKHDRRELGSASSYLTAMDLAPDVLSILTPDLKYRVEQHLIDFARVTLGVTKHQGKIGKVYGGMYSDKYHSRQKPVLIKTLSERTPRQTQYFLEDSVMMREFEHPNVLPLVGIALSGNHIYSVVPMVENGNFKSFIASEENMLTVGELLNLGLQISKGMDYLSEHKLVHKDLATRNCVVDKDMVVKVTDRALSRDLFPQEYWKSPDKSRSIPIRWMAPETLEIDVFSVKSDVWAFGILLWELLTRGCMPYPDVRSHSITNFLLCGNRMDRPDFSPEEVYALMLECWDDSPRQRPLFPEVSERLSAFLFVQNSQTNMKSRSRQVPSSRRKGLNYTHLYS